MVRGLDLFSHCQEFPGTLFELGTDLGTVSHRALKRNGLEASTVDVKTEQTHMHKEGQLPITGPSRMRAVDSKWKAATSWKAPFM